MNGIEKIDKAFEIYAMETASICNMCLMESTSSKINRIIERIKRLIKEIKRKIEKVIKINEFEMKKSKLIKKLKHNKLVRFKPVKTHNLQQIFSNFNIAFNRLKDTDDPDGVIEEIENTTEHLLAKEQEYRLGEVVKNINISKYIDLMDRIDDETDKQNAIYNKLIKNEEENYEEIRITIQRLRALSNLTNLINNQVTRELQFVSMILKYD